MREKFDALVKGLDAGALAALRESIAAELEGRGEAGFQIGSIRPGMSADEKERAQREIARVLREG